MLQSKNVRKRVGPGKMERMLIEEECTGCGSMSNVMLSSAELLHKVENGGALGAAFHGRRMLAWIILDEKHVRYFNVFFEFFIG